MVVQSWQVLTSNEFEGLGDKRIIFIVFRHCELCIFYLSSLELGR